MHPDSPSAGRKMVQAFACASGPGISQLAAASGARGPLGQGTGRGLHPQFKSMQEPNRCGNGARILPSRTLLLVTELGDHVVQFFERDESAAMAQLVLID